jgi:O-antigen/teichoic acid export membrane protein
MGYSLAGQVSYLLSQLAILVALTQLRGAEAVGTFGVALALTTPFFMFVGMGGRASQASDVTQRYSFAEYAGLVLLLATAATIASIGTGLIFTSNNEAFLIVVVVALTKTAESVSTIAYGAFQQAARPDKISLSLLLRGVLTVPLFVAILLAGAPIGLAFAAQLIVWTTVALFRDYPLASTIAAGRTVLPSRDFRRLILLARETAPLGASYGVNALLVSLPRLFVERSLGVAAVGVLTVVTYFLQAGTVLITSMSQPLVNRFARLRLAGDSSTLRKTVVALAALFTVISAAGILLASLIGEQLLTVIFGAEFAGAADLLMLVAFTLAAQLLIILPQSIVHADRRYSAFLFREVASVIACLALLAWLVPSLQLIGAGLAILGAAVFRLVVVTVAVTLVPARRAPAGATRPSEPDASVA